MLTAKRFAIGVGLAIILPTVVNFGSATFLHGTETLEVWFAIPIGLIALIIGALTRMNGVGPGLMFGGIFTAVDGYATYWFQLHDSTKFVASLIAFLVVLAVGVFKVAREDTTALAERAS